MKKVLFFIILFLFFSEIKAQTKTKLIHKKGCIILINDHNIPLDTMFFHDNSKRPKIQKIDTAFFVVQRDFNMFYLIQKFHKSHDGIYIEKSVNIGVKKGCFSLKDFANFKVKVNKKGIIWKFRKNRKKQKGIFLFEEFYQNQTLELPKELCNESPFYD